MIGFQENVKNLNFCTLIPLILELRFSFKIPALSLFKFIAPNFMQSFIKNLWAVSEIFKDWRTDSLTDVPQTRVITKDPVKYIRGPK